MADCAGCGRKLTRDEAGLTRKMVNRNAEKLYCLTCLSADFRVSEEQLREMIERFREAGCTLFK